MSRIVGAIIGALAAGAVAIVLVNIPIAVYIIAGLSLGWFGAAVGAAIAERIMA